MNSENKILLTGALGFIGYHTTLKLVEKGYEIYAIDNINNYYDTNLKKSKLPLLGFKKDISLKNKFFKSYLFNNLYFAVIDIKDKETISFIFESISFNYVINLAAQAGVQYSLKNPYTYIENNISGFINLIENSNKNNINHFIYASSSSVYGDRVNTPFNEDDLVDKPISLYAASKKANELIAHSYSHLYNLKTTALRFFTVYGPWGRPDMAPFIFLSKILNGDEINVFNNGEMLRDFTYVDDIVEGILKVLVKREKIGKNYEIYNIGNSNPTKLMDFIDEIQNVTNIKAKIKFKPLRAGDVLRTYSDSSKLFNDFNYKPKTKLKDGLEKFYEWYLDYFKLLWMF